jgi:hypothetical protein
LEERKAKIMNIRQITLFIWVLLLSSCGSWTPDESDFAIVVSDNGAGIPVFELGWGESDVVGYIESGTLVVIGQVLGAEIGSPCESYRIATKSGRKMRGSIRADPAHSNGITFHFEKWDDPSVMPPVSSDIPNIQALALSVFDSEAQMHTDGNTPDFYPISAEKIFAVSAMLDDIACSRGSVEHQATNLTRGQYETSAAHESRQRALLDAGIDSLVQIARSFCGIDIESGIEFEVTVPIARVVDYDPDTHKMYLESRENLFTGVLPKCLGTATTLPIAYLRMYDEVFGNVNIASYKQYHNFVRTSLGSENNLLVGEWTFNGPGFPPDVMPVFANLVSNNEITARLRLVVSFNKAVRLTQIERILIGTNDDNNLITWGIVGIPIDYNTGRKIHNKILVKMNEENIDAMLSTAH